MLPTSDRCLKENVTEIEGRIDAAEKIDFPIPRAVLAVAGRISDDGGGMISPQQHKKMAKKYSETKKVGESADKAGVDRKTARKYLKKGVPGPQEQKPLERSWRTHPDPFKEVWSEVEQMLGREPGLQAKTIFEELQRRYPGKFTPGQKRSLERRVREWKDSHGSEPILTFSQEHRPGERMQLDWTHCDKLGVRIAGQPFPHLLVHAVFPYSNWEWARVCRSESYASLRMGMQSAVWAMGGVPKEHQTDQSSTATHSRGSGKGREFNGRYLGLCLYYGMQARVIGVAEPEQNGDVETAHGHLKTAIDQALRLRGSREFTSIELYEEFVTSVVQQRNAPREKKVAIEKAALNPLPDNRLPEYDEITGDVNREGIVRVGKQGYSVPARWVGRKVRVRIEESKVEIYCAKNQECILSTPRNSSQGTYIDWRHVIIQLLRKPGAFERWRYRESMYPNLLWRQLYDQLRKRYSNGRAEREYLRILALALEHPIEDIEARIEELGSKVCIDTMRQSFGIRTRAVVDMDFEVNVGQSLAAYDGLINADVVSRKQEVADAR